MFLTLWDRVVRTNLPSGRHRFEDAADDLRGASASHLVVRFRFEQLGIREDDAELIVQSMEEESQIARLLRRCRGRPPIRRGHHDASLVRSLWRRGSRHSVSTKMRTDPPAVRTYSTFPLAIQQHINIRALAELIVPYPTLTELGKRAAIGYFAPNLTRPLLQRIILFLRRFG